MPPIRVAVELAPMCSGAMRPVDALHLAQALASGVQRVIDGAGVIDPTTLESSGEGCAANWELEVPGPSCDRRLLDTVHCSG